MADAHEVLVWKVISDWSVQNRGRLYCMRQGMAVPINADHPIWFGPLKRKFKGYPDLFGFENIETPKDLLWTGQSDSKISKNRISHIPVFTVVEVKIPPDKTSKDQIRVLDHLVEFGCHAYIAMAQDHLENSYVLRTWENYKKLYL